MRVVSITVFFAFLFSVHVFADAYSIQVSSPAFAYNGPIPAKYSLHGGNISPELKITGVPDNAKSIVVIVKDPDSPSGLWTHWIVWNIPPATTDIAEGKVPSGAVVGKNSFGHAKYDGPIPPSGTHHYSFNVYVLDSKLSLPAGSTREAVMSALTPHLIVFGETTGTFSAP